MSFDAGSIIAHMDLDDAEFDRKLREDVAKIEAFERRTHEAKISAEMDPSGLDRARQQFTRFDRQITQDAQQRARTHGSVLGALMGMFGGSRAAGGGTAGRSLLGGILGGAGPVPTGIPVGARAVLAATGGAVGLGALPALLGGVLPLGTAALGAGGVGLGASQLIGTKNRPGAPATQGPLYDQAQAALKSIKAAFDQGIKPLIQPLERAFSAIPRLIRSIQPALRQLFSGAGTLIMPVLHGLTDLARTVLPLLGQAFRATAPLIRPLLGGFSSLLRGLLPGIISLLRAASPAVHALAGILGELGRGIGMMLRDFAPAVRASSTIFKALGDVLAAVFPIIGKLASTFARSLAPVFVTFAGVIKQLLPYLKIVGNVLASLAGAVLKDLVTLFSAFARLLISVSPAIRILAGALERVFNVLESAGVFGVLSSALEQIVPSLARFVNLLVRQLAPDLPVLTQALAVFSNLLITLVAAGLNTILRGLTGLLRRFPQLVPILGFVTAAWLAWNLVMDANPIGLIIIAITALVGAITLLARHWGRVWGDIKNWAMDAWQFLTHGWGQLLIPGLTAIRYAVEFVRDHWRGAWNDIRQIGLTAWHIIHDDIVAPLINTFTQTIPNAFSNAVRWIGQRWVNLQDVVRKPVAWVIDHVLNGLIGAFDWITSKVGLGRPIPKINIPGLRSGGRLPGYGGGDIQPALLEPGETVVSKEDSRKPFMRAAFEAAGVPGYQQGGPVGGAPQLHRMERASKRSGGWLGDLANGIGHLVHKALDIGKITSAIFTGNTRALVNAITDLAGGGVGGATGELAKILTAMPRMLIREIAGWFIGQGGGASANAIVKFAESFIGKVPYVWGGDSPRGWDCSGFVKWIYNHFGYHPPRTAAAQWGWVRRTRTPMPGGLAFFSGADGSVANPGHVGIVVGPNRMVDAYGTGFGTRFDTIRGSSGAVSGYGIPPGGFRGVRGRGMTQPGSWTLPGLEGLWRSAGGPGGMIAHIAGAIALAESGGNPLAHNPSGASGLWQILGQVRPGNIFNPFVNALNAVTKYRDAGGFRPWVTWTSGAYRQFMDRGGWMLPGRAYHNATGQPEAVLNPAQSDAFLALAAAAERGQGAGELVAEIKAMRRELAQLLRRAPAATGAAISDALDGGSRQASYRAQYSAR